ncbi:MAG TPA: ASKHA domain-containing protein [bacterium]|nr:ASKHA domain-containing protein [bacterium]HOL35048.1 ASKHA domain-containing protein [bacterium]HPP08409.1 ASKHA domain-containing protein [bacterium]
MKNIKVIFEPGMIEVDVPEGSKIISAIERSGIPFELPCGGKGVCGKCGVVVVEGASAPTETEKKLLGGKVKSGWRLACQSRVYHHCRILIEGKSSSYHKILTTKVLCDMPRNPQITKKHLVLPPITLDHPVSLQQQIAMFLGVGVEQVNPLLLREPSLSRGNDFTVVFHNGSIIAIEKGDTTQQTYGIGFDLGTTTMVLTLFDLVNCREVVTVVRPNPQIKFGDDVISRIDFSLKESGLNTLCRVVIDEINKMIDEAVKTAGIKNHHIYQFVLSGNTVMEHIFLNLPLLTLSKIPFNPVMKGPVEFPAYKAGLHINSEGRLFIFPVLGGFVGGDTTGLILATGIHRSENIQMGIDIGTNGEIVIGNKDGIIAASTAAGPAFEGGRITFGMRAQTGALERCWFSDGKLHWQIIGGNSLKGICGSGLVDLVTVLRQQGIINETGRFDDQSTSQLAKMLKSQDGNQLFILEPESVYLTQKDVREFQAAKAAIRSGIEILMKIRNVEINDIENVYLAGALGNFVNIENLKTLKMLPEFPSEKIIPSGNTSLASTLLFLCNADLRKDIEYISGITKTIELSLFPSFQEIFTEALLF